MPITFITHQNARGRFYFVLESVSGEALVTSEPFNFRIACLKAIQAMRAAGTLLRNYNIGLSTSGHHFFAIRSDDGEILASSGFFAKPEDMHQAIQHIRLEIMKAPLIETSQPR